MDKTLRKQIKQDELVTGFEHAHAWISAHGEEVRATLIGLALLVVVGGGLLYYRSYRTTESRRAFEAAMEEYQAPVGASSEDSSGPSFASKDEKYQKALASFEGVADRYSSLPEGRRARYYAGLCRIELGQLDEAETTLRTVIQEAGGNGQIAVSLAQMALARIDKEKGQLDQAVDTYQKLLDESPPTLPKDAVLSELGQTLEAAGRFAEAGAAFRRLVEEFPASTYASQARARADALKLAAAG